jgi:hypothetical protein
MRFPWSVFTFAFSFLFLFAAINGWTPTKFLEEMYFVFHLPRTLYFSLLSFNECSFFLELHLTFVFCLDFCSDLVLSVHQGVFRPLVYIGFIKRKGLNGIGKEKKVSCKKWYKKELV